MSHIPSVDIPSENSTYIYIYIIYIYIYIYYIYYIYIYIYILYLTDKAEHIALLQDPQKMYTFKLQNNHSV